jgi:hypothetical protein
MAKSQSLRVSQDRSRTSSFSERSQQTRLNLLLEPVVLAWLDYDPTARHEHLNGNCKHKNISVLSESEQRKPFRHKYDILITPHPKTTARNTCTTKTQTKTNPKQQTQQTTQPPKRRSAQQPPTTTNKKQTHQNEKLKKERMC